MKEIDNYTNKPLHEFTENDTLYIQKIISGYMYFFLIKFKSCDKSKVTGEIIDIQPNNTKGIWINKEYFAIGSDITSMIKKCYTYKRGSGCKWFNKNAEKNWVCL